MNALLIIDMQENYFEKHGYNREIIPKVNRRIEAATTQKELVVYVKNIAGTDFAEGLQMVSGDVFMKKAPDAFSNPELDTFLKKNKVTVVEAIGIDGNCCVYKTALGAVRCGYETYFNPECVGAKSGAVKQKVIEEMRKKGIRII
ncbi:Nicotinamidase-related amidase [Lachnospiraceae bacterium XBB1006]|nr:Nicotinamidase-related amidase [Lachnospiraceae bacterium XBB1006]